MSDSQTTDPTLEQWEEIRLLFGSPAPPIVRTQEDEAYLDWHIAYVEREGHQP